MKLKILIFIFVYCICESLGDLLEECNVQFDKNAEVNWESSFINLRVTDVQSNFTVTITYTNDFKTDGLSGEAAPYLEFVPDETNSKITIQLTEDFKNIESNFKDDAAINLFIKSATISFICQNSEPVIMTLRLYVTDTNNHIPTLKTTSYEYNLPVPISPKLDLSSVGEAIIAEDIDLSNDKITFETDSTDFVLAPKFLSGKQYQASLKATKYVTSDQDFTFQIRALDKDGRKSKDATVTIKIDKDSSFITPPTFENPIYEFEYKEDNGTPSISPTDGKKITVNTINPENTDVKLSDETYFNTTFDKTTNEVTIKSSGTPIPASTKSVLTLTLSVSLNSETSGTVISISLPADKVITAPKFSQSYYTGLYTVNPGENDDVVTLNLGISVSDNADVTISDNDNFIINPEDKSQLKVIKELDDNVIKSGKDIILTLTATVTVEPEEFSSTADVIVKMPTAIASPKFTQVIYSGEIQDNSVKVDSEIKAASGTETVEITIDPANDYFKIEQDSEDKWIVTRTATELPNDKTDIVVSLKAIIPEKDVEPGYATLIVSIPTTAIVDSPKFTEVLYYGEIQDDNSVKVDSEIKAASGTETVEITIDPANDYFKIEQDSEDKWIVTRTATELPNDKTDIVVSLKATIPGKDVEPGYATLVVSIPTTATVASPKFSQVFYSGEIQNDNSIKVNPEIEVASGTETVEITIDPANNYLKIEKDSDNKWVVSRTDNALPSDMTEIIVSLKATIPDKNVEPGYATLVVTIPATSPISAPTFSNPFYTASYKINSDTGKDTVEFDSPIAVTTEDGSTPTVTISQNYADSFKVDCTETCTITVSKELSPEILASETEVILVLEASKPDVAEKSTATVIIALPLQETAKAPEFEKPVYVAVYNSDKTITIEDPQITIVGLTNINEITMTLEGTYNTDFSINPKNDHWEITVNNLSESIISKEISIQLTLIAQKTGVKVAGKAALVVQLPKKIASSDFYFEKNVYMADYNEDTKDLTTVDEISITGDTDTSADVTFSGDNANLFDKPTYVNSKITLKLKDGIPDDIIKNNVAISVDIIATKASEPESATTTLVIRLPKTESDSLSFTEVTYTASYTVVEGDNNDKVEIENALIKINGETDATKVDLTIEDPNMQKYFKLIPESDHWTIGVVEDYPTDDNVSILLILQAVKGSLQGKVGVVIKLPKKVVAKSFNFKQNVYTGDYSVGDDEHGILNIPEVITVVGNDLDQVLIELSGNYKAYFNQTFENGVVKITLKSDLADEILNNQVVITVDIVATKASETDIATLVLTLPKKVTPTTLYFDNNIYLADYKIDDDDDVDFSLEKEITLVGASADVILTISGDYNNNFGVTNSNGKISLTLVKELDSEIVDSETAITLDITAKENDETTKTSVVIKLPKADTDSSDDKSGLIAAISVLAVLLVAALVGSAVFYYFKFRRGNSYSNMEDSRPSERFRKNSRTEGTNKFEHPTRRPTGVIKYPLDDVAGETEDTEPELNLDKRKSVQFDTINVDELEIEKSEDDLESNYDTLDVEDKENLEAEDDERRISKV